MNFNPIGGKSEVQMMPNIHEVQAEFDQFEFDFLDAKNHTEKEVGLREYESKASTLTEDLVIRLVILRSIFFQRDKNPHASEEKLNEVAEKMQNLKWESLSNEQIEKVGVSIHQLTNDVAYRINYTCYAKFVNLIKDHVPDCIGKFLTLGNYQLNQCQLEEGIESCNYVLEKATDDRQRAEAINILAASYMFTGEYDKVLEEIEKALTMDLNPNIRVNFWRKMADTYMAKGEFTKARSSLENAKAVFGEFDNILLNFTTLVREGVLLSREGNYESALKKFQEVRQLLPNANPGQKSLVIGNVGLLLERMRNAKVEASGHILEYFKKDAETPEEDLPLAFVKYAYEIQKDNLLTRLILGSNLVNMCESRKLPTEGYKGEQYKNWMPFPFGWDVL